MKRLLVFFLALLPFVSAFADNDPAVNRETQTYQLDGFDALEASWMYQVELSQSPSFSVSVEAPDFVMPFLDVRVRNGFLKLSVQDMPKDIRRKLENGSYEIYAKVSMPELSAVELSGAAKLESFDAFKAPKENFSLDLSGASAVKSLKVSATHCKIDCSGASKFSLNGNFQQIRIGLSGAASGKMASDSQELNLDLSGSAKLFLSGNHQKVKAEVSGAGNVEMEGAAERLVFNGSGAAKGYFLKCPVLEASVGLSGAARIHLDVKEDLAVRLTAAASCYYRAGEHLTLSDIDVSRGATLKKL